MATFKEFGSALGLEPRESQQRLATAINEALTTQRAAFIEGGTGNGKTFSYLQPVLEQIRKHQNVKVVISTATMVLQNQIVGKDLPAAFRAMKKIHGADYHNNMSDVGEIVGARNYLCEESETFMKEGGEAALMVEQQMGARDFKALKKIVSRMKTDKAPVRWRDLDVHGIQAVPHAVKDKIGCRSMTGCKCFSKGSEKNCSYATHYREVIKPASIVVCNHAYLSTNTGILWDKDIIIVDEAHKLPEVLSHANSAEFSLSGFRRICEAFLADTEQMSLLTSLNSQISDARLHVENLHAVLTEAEEAVIKACQDKNKLSISYKDAENNPIEAIDIFKRVADTLKFDIRKMANVSALWQRHVGSSITNLKNNIERLYGVDKGASDPADPNEKGKQTKAVMARGQWDQMSNLARVVDRLSLHVTDFCNMAAKASGKNNVIYFEKGLHNVSVFSAPLDHRVAQAEIAGRVFMKATPVFVSSTLSAAANKSDFNHFKRELGFERWYKKGRPIEIQEPSCFEWDKQSLLVIPNDLPQPNYGADAPDSQSSETICYYAAIHKSINDCVRHVNGNSLVLCSSLYQVDSIATYLKKHVGDDVLILSQANGQSLERMLHKMRQGIQPKKVLVGMQSLWQGVDLPGESLRGLFIVKIPFPVPNHPLVEQRANMWQEVQKKSYFSDVLLPEAVNMIRQGSGRLIRSADVDNEYGVIVFYDYRMAAPPKERKPYISKIHGSFPESMPEARLPLREVADTVRDYFDSKITIQEDITCHEQSGAQTAAAR
jgi:ATP-dependent DNA helicase DinG